MTARHGFISPTGRSPWGLLIILCLQLVLPGCSVSYLLQAAAGQFRILNNSVPLETALADPGLDPDQREKLLLVPRIKAFGEEELGLAATDNYETVYLQDEKNPVYSVSAARKTRLQPVTWWFPVVGRVPYLGYFDPEAAGAKKEELQREGFDAVIWPAEAYSTLGWFQDPVHKNLLEGSAADLAETILHEMTHATLYVKSEPLFNESLASLIGKRGALAFLEREFGPESPQARGMRSLVHDERLFSRALDPLFTRLHELYNGPLTEEEKLAAREEVFQRFLEDYERMSTHYQTDRFKGFGSGGLNNAYILTVALYHRHFNLFESVLEKTNGSIPEALGVFREISAAEEDLILRTREWLE